MHLLIYLLQQTIVEIGHFLTREGKETKLCLLSTQEKLMNSCKSTPKSEYWVWLSMVQKMSGILIGSRLSPCVHVDSIYYCNCKVQADASMLFNEIY